MERYGPPYGGSVQRGHALIDPKLLEILACPLCPERPPLEEKGAFLVCTRCGSGYPVRDGIPFLLPEEAIPADRLKEQTDGE